jgi:hypothetical protein
MLERAKYLFEVAGQSKDALCVVLDDQQLPTLRAESGENQPEGIPSWPLL